MESVAHQASLLPSFLYIRIFFFQRPLLPLVILWDLLDPDPDQREVLVSERTHNRFELF